MSDPVITNCRQTVSHLLFLLDAAWNLAHDLQRGCEGDEMIGAMHMISEARQLANSATPITYETRLDWAREIA
jgi:hypothetical protein